MRLLIINHIQNAYQSLRANRLRAILTMLGITIGVASITAILALSNGATRLVSQQVDALGGNVAVVRPGGQTATLSNLATSSNQQAAAASTLTEKDLEAIQLIPGVESVAPIMLINGSPSAHGGEPQSATIVATTPSLMDISNLEIRDGQFMDSVTNKSAAVIGSQLSVNLFVTYQSIGNNFSLRGQTYTVIGVLKRQNNPVNFNNVDFDNTAIISLQSGKTFYEDIAHIQQINIRANSVANLKEIINEIDKILIKNHQGEHDFTILSGEAISQPTNQLYEAIAGVGAAIAGVSLVVGGIGIMNIMLVNVAERTREIGIRKALGASNAHITWQFLIESLVLGLGGGISGYFIGYIVAFAISTVVPFTPSFSWEIAGIAIAVSLIVGVVFGIYPAIRAARKDPIESLRYYI